MTKKIDKYNHLKIATYNVRSLSSTEKYTELMYALQNINIDILGLAETRRMGCKIEEHDNHIFCYVGETPGLYGVGFLIKKEHKTNIINFTGLSERVALLQLTFNGRDLSIIQAYAPTETAKEEEVEAFYKTLKEAHNLAENCKNLMVIGDFNAKIGMPKPSENLIMGRYGYGKRNKRGERLIQYAFEHKLSIMNTHFKKKNNRKWTWITPDNKTKNEIDFIMTSSPRNIINIEVLNNVEFPSDHRIVRATLMFQKGIRSRKHFVNSTTSLKSEEEIKAFLSNLESNFNNQPDIEQEDIQQTYDKFELRLKNSLKLENVDKSKKNSCDFYSETTKLLIQKRTDLLKTKNKSQEMKKELSNIFKQTSKSIRNDYKQHRKNILENTLTRYRSAKKGYKQLLTHTDWIQSLKQGSALTKSRKNVITSATNFYKKLYATQTQDTIPDIETNRSDTNTNETFSITEDEVLKHILKLKPEKSPGPDGLKNEMLKIGAKQLTKPLTRIFNKIIEIGKIPEQWYKSDIILLYKKGDPLDIANYRPISLLSVVYKLFTSILQDKIAPHIENTQPVEQAGFRTGFSTMDHIHTLGQIIEKHKEFNKGIYICFIDYSKAFDSINHNFIWKALHECNVNPKIMTILKNIYRNSVSRVKLETRGDEIKVERGVRQGDPLSPKLFIAVLQYIFSKLNWDSEGIQINNKRLSHLRFADDIVVFAETYQKLQNMINQLNEESKLVGLHMNLGKTKIMTNSKKGKVMLENVALEYVEQYIYLGKQVSFRKTSNEDEVNRRISSSWNKFWAQKEVLKGNYDLEMKKTVMDTCILPCLTYGSQTWTFTEKIKNKITSSQRAMERSILNLRKIYKVRSQEIRKKTKVTDMLHQALKLKWNWAGHVARYTDQRWTLKSTNWRGPPGKRKVGKPQKRWVDEIKKVAGKNWFKTAQNREQWKKLEEAYTLTGVPI